MEKSNSCLGREEQATATTKFGFSPRSKRGETRPAPERRPRDGQLISLPEKDPARPATATWSLWVDGTERAAPGSVSRAGTRGGRTNISLPERAHHPPTIRYFPDQ